jgi:hypothetical protein
LNYGIEYCEERLEQLKKKEAKRLDSLGYGFDRYCAEFGEQVVLNRILRRFRMEKRIGINATYDPKVHGCFEEESKDD